jgi:hypothetical protein
MFVEDGIFCRNDVSTSWAIDDVSFVDGIEP